MVSIKKQKKKVINLNNKVTIFKFDMKDQEKEKIELAKVSLKRLKTIKHPKILKYLE